MGWGLLRAFINLQLPNSSLRGLRGTKAKSKDIFRKPMTEEADTCVRVWGVYGGSLTVISKIPFSHTKPHLLVKHQTL